MIASRAPIAARTAARSLRAPAQRSFRQVRFETTQSTARPAAENASSSSGSQATGSAFGPGLAGGLVGGGLVFLTGYTYYHFSGAKTLVQTAKSTKKRLGDIKKQTIDQAPEPSEALKWLRQTATSYAVFIPGAKHYIDTTFDDLETIHEKHRDEVDKILGDAYAELKEASSSGATTETAIQSWNVLQKYMAKIASLAGDSMEDILERHPALKKQVGGNLEQLKNYADVIGPEAKEQLDKTYKQISEVLQGGLSASSMSKVKQIVQEKGDLVKKMGEEAWKKGEEQLGPYLDKNPQVKKIVEENKDVLKSGNVMQLVQKVKDAVSGGDTKDLEQFVKQAKDKASQKGGDWSGMLSGMMSGAGISSENMESIAKMIPGGEQILPKLQKLQEVGEKHGDEAKKILEKTYQEVSEVLSKRMDEVEKLGKDAGKDAEKKGVWSRK